MSHWYPRQSRPRLLKGERVRQVSTKAWYKALARADIKNFRWHESAPHLGELACAERDAALRASGVRCLGNRKDGAPLRALRPESVPVDLSDLYFGWYLWVHQRCATVRINDLSRDPARLF
jgi:hypothetical protein